MWRRKYKEMKCLFHWVRKKVLEIQFLINLIRMVIIDIGAFAYMSIYDESQIIALIMLTLGNSIGGVLYKYSKK